MRTFRMAEKQYLLLKQTWGNLEAAVRAGKSAYGGEVSAIMMLGHMMSMDDDTPPLSDAEWVKLCEEMDAAAAATDQKEFVSDLIQDEQGIWFNPRFPRGDNVHSQAGGSHQD